MKGVELSFVWLSEKGSVHPLGGIWSKKRNMSHWEARSDFLDIHIWPRNNHANICKKTIISYFRSQIWPWMGPQWRSKFWAFFLNRILFSTVQKCIFHCWDSRSQLNALTYSAMFTLNHVLTNLHVSAQSVQEDCELLRRLLLYSLRHFWIPKSKKGSTSSRRRWRF